MKTPLFFLLVLLLGLPFNAWTQLQTSFNADFVEVCAPEVVQFTDLSTATNTTITQWEWSRDGAVFSTLQNPALLFNTPGNYEICLKITDNLGNQDSLCIPSYVKAYQSPTANFAIDSSFGCTPLTSNFTDLSLLGDAPIQEWRWDFGDGDTNFVDQHPTHVYSTVGTFDVTLVVIDTNGCSSSLLMSNLVSVAPTVTASIVHNSFQVQCGLPASVQFTGISNAPNVTYSWDMGDNTIATGQTVTHNYTAAGCFAPTLTVSSSFCSATATVPACITVVDAPTASFSIADSTNCYVPFTPSITNQSTGFTSLQWDMGDSSFYSTLLPNHTYTHYQPLDSQNYDDGVFPIILTVSNAAGCVDRDTQLIYISQIKAIINSGAPVCAPDTAFYEVLDDNISPSFYTTNWSWTLDNGNPSTTAFAHAYYPDSGIYNVQAIITDNIGCMDTATRVASIGIMPTIDSVTVDTNIACRSKGINFIGYGSSFITDWAWSFNDGSSGNNQAFNHSFQDTGWHSGFALASFRHCIDTFQLDSYHISPPVALAFPYIFCDTLQVDFQDLSIGADHWFWEFGDTTTTMDTSSLQHPSYLYPDTGSYFGQLTVVNDSTGCIDSFEIVVQLGDADADFTIPDSVCAPAPVVPTNTSIGSGAYLWVAQGSDPFTDIDPAPLLNFRTPGVFPIMLVAFDINGCPDTLVKNIHVAGIDTLITHSPDPTCRPTMVQFVDSSVGIVSPIVNWQWSGGGNQTTKNVFYNFPGPQVMTLTLTNTLGCTFPVNDTIEVGGLFVNFNSAEDVCINSPMTAVALTSSPANANSFPPYTYVWDFGDGHRDTTTSPTIIHIYDSAGVYDLCLDVIDALGCISSLCRPDWVEVHDPTALFTADTFYSSCPPLQVNFSNLSLSGSQWLWSFGDGSVSSLENPTHIYSTPGFYDVILSVEAIPGCTHVDTIIDMIQISGPSGNFVMPQQQSCAPYTAQFTGTGTNVATYTWLFGNGDIQANTTNAPTDTTTYTYTQAGVYIPVLVVDDGMGCQIPIEQDTIFIFAPPSPLFNSDSLVCEGDSIQFQIQNTITNNMTFEWLFQGASPNSSTALNPKVHYPDTGSFDVQLILWEDGCSDTLTKSNFIRVKPKPIAHFGMSVADSCTPVLVAFIDSSSTVNGTIQSWFWDFNNGETATSPDSSLWYYQDGTFNPQLIVSNNFGCWDTLVQSFSTHPSPTGNAGNYPTVCLGDTIQLTATGNGNFAWSSAAWISDTSIANPITIVDSSHQYILEISNSLGCTTFDTITIIAAPWQFVQTGDSLSICEGDTISLQATGTISNFDWGNSSALSCQFCASPQAFPTTTSTFYLQPANPSNCSNMDSIVVVVYPKPNAQVTADSSICLGDTVHFSATGGLHYQWTTNATISNNSISNPWSTPNASSNYTVVVTDSNNCQDSSTIVVQVSNVNFLALPDQTICRGDSAQLVLQNAMTPIWVGNSLSCNNCLTPIAHPTDSSLYIVTYYTPDNCPVQDSLWINVLDLRQLQALPSDTICLGDSIQLQVIGNDNAAVLWSPNYALSSPTSFSPIAFPDTNTMYHVQVQQGQCIKSDSLRITVQPPPAIAATGANYCIGDSAQLTVAGNAQQYHWSPNLFLNNNTLLSPTVSTTTNQQYQVVGTAVCGSDTAYAQVMVHPYPSMQLDSSIQALVGTSVTLHTNANPNHSFTWSPNQDLSCNNCPNPSWVVNGDAVFYVTITNSFGCSILDSIVIVPLDECIPDWIFVPNAFTPDEDGHNDVLYVQSGIVQEIESFQIYSRWGQLVFESNTMAEGWDGTYQGKPLPPDVFGYFVLFKCPNTGASMLKKGNITILR